MVYQIGGIIGCPPESQTLHRLLGGWSWSGRFYRCQMTRIVEEGDSYSIDTSSIERSEWAYIVLVDALFMFVTQHRLVAG